jgi:hypothetical protein
MGAIASEDLISRLADWGVDTVFGLPGDGINGLMEGLRRGSDRTRFVLVHHEEAAAFMACGYAKATGRLGVCLATSGPGAVHLLNGLYDAKLDHVPVLAITGMQETQMLGCGLAGNFGFEPGHKKISEACAEQVLMPRLRRAPKTTVVLADGFSCRTQVHLLDSANREALHLAELLHGALTGTAPKPGAAPETRWAVRPSSPFSQPEMIAGIAGAMTAGWAAWRRRARRHS